MNDCYSDSPTYFEKISGGGTKPRYLGVYATKAELDAAWPESSLGAGMAGSTATIARVPSTYQPGVGWVAQSLCASGIIYNGTTIPLPAATAGNAGMRILVVNPAVPRGFSRLESTGTIWAPPAGELIASTPPGLTTAAVTPATTSLTKIWESPVIPDYMLPVFLEMEISGNMGVRNLGAGVAGCILGCGICGNVPTSSAAFNYPLAANVSPAATFYNGIGAGNTGKRMLIFRNTSSFSHQDSSSAVGGITKDSGSIGNFVSDANRLYAMAKPSSTTDSIRLDGLQVWSKGNL